MNLFVILVGASFVGILGVFWLLKNEDKPSLRDLGTPMSAPVSPAKKPSLLAGILAKFKKGKKTSGESPTGEIPLPGVTDLKVTNLNEESFRLAQEEREAPSQGPNFSADEEKKIEQEINFSAQIEEWKEKYERLDKFFNEKSTALERSEESLRNELNNRKEFNKVKDILEKELRETKDRVRNVHVEMNAVKAEAEGSKESISQLEEKITKMEKVILEKDDEIAALTKRLEVTVQSSPVVATVPESRGSPISEFEQEKAGVGQVPVKEKGFLKPPPDVITAANPPVLSPGGESSQSDKPVEPEAKFQDAQGNPDTEGQINKDEQKAAP